jgi:hypothetical protein
VTSPSRPVFDVDFAGLPDASSWPGEYFKLVSATTAASATVSGGWGVLDLGTVASFGAGVQLRLWGYPIEGEKFEIAAKVKIISTGNAVWIEFYYRATNDPNDTRYSLNFSDTQYRIDRRSSFSGAGSLVTATQALAANAVVWIKIRVVGAKHMIKTWAEGATEPQTWNLILIDNTNARLGKMFINAGASDGGHRQIALGQLHVAEIGDPYEPVLSTTATATFSGTGAQTAFTFPHGLDGTPKTVVVSPRSAAAAPAHYVSAVDATNVTVTFTTAPASGTSNVIFDWRAEA